MNSHPPFTSTAAPQEPIKLGFESRTIEVGLSQIMPLKTLPLAIKMGAKYKQIMASIREVGIIESPVVTPVKGKVGMYLMLDGHLRIEALKDLGITHVTCLISQDDEAFTYNKHINRLSIIQEHRMIVEAIKRGVPEAKIAAALNINIKSIVDKRRLIDGICPEAVDLLKDKIIPSRVFGLLKHMKAMRQVEVATLMNDAGTHSFNYANALFAATPQDQLIAPNKPKAVKGLSEAQMSRMENEMDVIQKDYRLIEDNYGTDILNLTLARGYLGTLLGNSKVTRYLRQQHSEILSQFEKIADMTQLAGMEATAS